MEITSVIIFSLIFVLVVWNIFLRPASEGAPEELATPSLLVEETSMYKVMVNRDKIYDLVDGAASNCKWTQVATHEQFEKYCISKDTIQDTSEAISAHEEKGFCSETSLRYIEYYGLLQAVYLQQDSILALHRLFGETKDLNLSECSGWNEIREMRNDTVGHPVGRRKRLNRNQISYDDVHYMDIKKENIESWESYHVNLRKLLHRYGDEAAEVLGELHECIRKTCDLDKA